MTHDVPDPAPMNNPLRATARLTTSAARLISRGDARFGGNPRRWFLEIPGTIETEGRQLRPAKITLKEDPRENPDNFGTYLPTQNDDPEDVDVSLSPGQWQVVQEACLNGRPLHLTLTMVIDMDGPSDDILFVGYVMILMLDLSSL